MSASKLYQKIKNYINRRKARKIKTDVNIPLKRLGGDATDSSVIYLDDLSKKQNIIIYVAGIGEEINFELALLRELENKNVQMFAFDPTPKSAEFVKKLDLPDNFHFYPYAIVDVDKPVEFALPRNEGWVSGSCEDVKDDSRQFDFYNKIIVEGRSLSSIMQQLGHDHIDLLKMDIEGSEFVALNNVFSEHLAISQITLDYHDYMFDDGQDKLKHLLSKIKMSDYAIYYVEQDFNKNQNLGLLQKASYNLKE